MSDLAALRAEVAELRDLVRELVDEQRFVMCMAMAPADRANLAALLPAAHAVFGGGEWTAADLYAEALLDGTRTALRALVADYETPDGGRRSLGGFLERCAGKSFGGLRLEEVGKTRAGLLYRVERVSRRSNTRRG